MKTFLSILLAPSIVLSAPDFDSEIRPLLQEHCIECHGEKKQKSGLRLDSREFVLKGGELGPVVVPGKPEASRLILSINHVKAADVYAMPGEDEKLPPKAIAALTEWVRQGLPCEPSLYQLGLRERAHEPQGREVGTPSLQSC